MPRGRPKNPDIPVGRMMFQITMDKLEKALDQLDLKYQGHRVDSHEAWAIVGFWNGDTWKQMEREWIEGMISDKEFYERAMVMVNHFADRHQLRRPEVA